jgi:hypothetical protein
MTNPRVIRLADLNPEPTLIELDEHRYRLRQVTRSVQKNLDKALKALNATDESDDLDKQATALIDAVDVLLDPQDAAPAAKTVLLAAWKDDRLSAGQIGSLFEELNKSAARPT